MNYIKFKIPTTAAGLEPLCGKLYELGLTALEIENGDEFERMLREKDGSWDYADDCLIREKSGAFSVTVYFDDNAAGKEFIGLINEQLDVLRETNERDLFGGLNPEINSLAEEDWEHNWKTYFKPIPIGSRLLICPAWESVPPEYSDRVTFFVDPGMSFGTGSHESTRLCAKAAENHTAPGSRVLDIGGGSGILSIIALLLGADYACCVDIDPGCAEAANSNARRNNVAPERFRALTGNLLSEPTLAGLIGGGYNLIFINIVADVIIQLLPLCAGFFAPGGKLILSGILGARRSDVENALAIHGYDIIERLSENDWYSFAAVRK